MGTKSLKFDYIITFLTYALSFGSNFIIYYLISRNFGETGFEEYVLSKRFFGFVFVPIMIGVAVALPRYIAFNVEESNESLDIEYFLSASFFLCLIGLSASLVFLTFKEFISRLIFDSSSFAFLILPICFLIMGGIINALVFSYFRGRREMIKANVFSFLTVIVNMVFVLFTSSVYSFILLNAISLILASVVFFLLFSGITGEIWKNLDISYVNLRNKFKILSTYGLPRVPGDLAKEGIFAIPVVLASHNHGIEFASYVAFCGSFLSMIGTSMSPFNLVLLPYVVEKMVVNKYNDIKKHVTAMLLFVLIGGVIGSVAIFFLAEFIATEFLNISDPRMFDCLKIVSLAVTPYLVYLFLRSVNDAFYKKAVNSISLMISFIVLIISWSIMQMFPTFQTSIIVSIDISLFILGSLTYWYYSNHIGANQLRNPENE